MTGKEVSVGSTDQISAQTGENHLLLRIASY